MEDEKFPLCVDCGEEEATIGPDLKRCRDCDIQHMLDTWPRCEFCETMLFNDTIFVTQHLDDCPRKIAVQTGEA